jgi:beta-N-acetylhexosaminidase
MRKGLFMKKSFRILAVMIALTMFVSAFPVQNIRAQSETGTEESIDIDKQVNGIIANMTIEQKLAQMMIIAIRYEPDTSKGITKLTKAYKKLLKKYDFGGLIMYANNMTDINQTVTMIREAQSASMKSANGIPMFICVDQEGGLVNRVSFGTTGSGNMALAATGDTSNTEEIAGILGEEISALGFNMDFAPVSDVNNNPDNPVIGTRSFSDDPNTVAENVVAFIDGLNKYNISTSVKHFPGHGNVGEDSHTKLPLSELTLDELKECELIPFEAGIEAGADMIMTAHIQYPNIDDTTYISKDDGKEVYLPATLSKKIMTGLLRDEMGFDGIIISDSMQMDAIATHFDETDAAVLAINAGVDLLIRPSDVYQDDEINTFPDVNKYMKKLAARVKAGDITEERLDESVGRILRLKFKKGIMTDTLSVTKKTQIKNAKKVVGIPENHTREWEIASEGITLVKNENNAFPIDGMSGENTLILIPSEYRRASVEYAINRLEKESLVNPKNVDVICYSDITIKNKALKKALNKADNVLILSQSTKKNDLVCSIIEKAHKNGAKVTFLSLNLPYDIACYTDVDAALCAYHAYGSAYDSEGNGPFNLNVAVAVCSVFAESVPQGTLPVNIPKIIENEDGSISYSDQLLYERGFGICVTEK